MPTYIANLTREHKTDKIEGKSSLTGEAYSVARSVHERVAIDFPRPVKTIADFQEFRAAVIAKASPQTDDWEDWHFRGALENGDCPPPPEMLTPAKSKAAKAAQEQAKEYRTLYGASEYTPFRVFEHWFCTIGNGMEWLSNGTYGELGRTKKKSPERLAEDEVWEQAYGSRSFDDHRPSIRDEVGLYPLSETYSDIYNIPQNVEDSFLLAAVDLCNYYLSRPTRYSMAYEPHYVERDLDYAGNTWQAMVMKDAAHYRGKLEKAYDEIWNMFGSRLQDLGVQKVEYIRDDTPFGHFVPGDYIWVEMAMTPEERARREALLEEIFAKLASEEGPSV